MRKHAIACAVLEIDFAEAIRRRGTDRESVSLELLPGGLHNTPRLLREKLQSAIDSAPSEAEMILIGYGVCGMGTVGLHARSIPLAIPRVHDCISLFLGSDQAYREQFRRYPGTYYLSAGWVEGRTQPQSVSKSGHSAPTPEDFAALADRYGKENTQAIRDFFSSWQRNYQRSAFIDTGAVEDTTHYEAMARDMAQEYGWRYERLGGSLSLLESLLDCTETTPEILMVPPGSVTRYDSAERKLQAQPVWQDKVEDEDTQIRVHSSQSRGGARGIGLGIDAGGTYTDAVIFDFAGNRVLDEAKAPTTRWDFTVGIRAALDHLDPSLVARIELVSVSTTLATNAIVEDRGQTVGLLVMPPYGRFDPTNFRHEPLVAIDGQLEIDGTEIAPVNPDQVRRLVRDLLGQGVGAFAVAGYASHNNPSHELLVKSIIQQETSMTVTCGHEVSEGLNYRVRAETAALNARIIPNLDALLKDIENELRGRGIEAPIMVVKSDGSLSSLEAARERPIETILSGPAASVAGARHLTGAQDALVVDIGGTTSDTAMLRGGEVQTSDDGAVVGPWKTHVRALAMRTLGLGGDSRVALMAGRLSVGPRRVAPISWLADRFSLTTDALRWIETHLDAFSSTTEGMEILALTTESAVGTSERENAVIRVLTERPFSVKELAARLGLPAWQFLSVDRLEEQGLVQRVSLTPTDALCVLDRVQLWNPEAARHLCTLYGRLVGCRVDQFAEKIVQYVERRLAEELLRGRLDSPNDDPRTTNLVQSALDDDHPDLKVRIELTTPIIGIGAPVAQFLPAAARLLHTEAVIPEHAAVANAVGAITSTVSVRRTLKIVVGQDGVYRVRGVAGAPGFPAMEDAHQYAVESLEKLLMELGSAAGASGGQVDIAVRDQVARSADGTSLFLGRLLEGRIVGQPGPSETTLPGRRGNP